MNKKENKVFGRTIAGILIGFGIILSPFPMYWKFILIGVEMLISMEVKLQ